MRVILGITGCIAAYKSALVLRLLQKQGCEVQPVMTASAQQFITPLTLEKLSGRRVVTDLFRDQSAAIEHIALARESDLLLVAPATANTLAKFAHGLADDFLSTLYVSTTTPVVVAPGMNVEMWRHASTQENLQILHRRGVRVVEPEAGYLACGEVGEGRMAEPEEIVAQVLGLLGRRRSLDSRRVLVTAGPTIEDLDPVRFLSNRSSGKMGYAVAAEAAARGGRVTLVSGPTQLSPPAGCEFVPVRSAADMAQAVLDGYPEADIVVMSAAVCDFRPAQVSPRKIKKGEGRLRQLEVTPTKDILQELGARKKGQFLVGFAAESDSLEANARDKLQRKNLDLIVANDISQPGQGFQADDNRVSILRPDGKCVRSELLPKNEIAGLIWDQIEKALKEAPRLEPEPRS